MNCKINYRATAVCRDIDIKPEKIINDYKSLEGKQFFDYYSGELIKEAKRLRRQLGNLPAEKRKELIERYRSARFGSEKGKYILDFIKDADMPEEVREAFDIKYNDRPSEKRKKLEVIENYMESEKAPKGLGIAYESLKSGSKLCHDEKADAGAGALALLIVLSFAATTLGTVVYNMSTEEPKPHYFGKVVSSHIDLKDKNNNFDDVLKVKVQPTSDVMNNVNENLDPFYIEISKNSIGGLNVSNLVGNKIEFKEGNSLSSESEGMQSFSKYEASDVGMVEGIREAELHNKWIDHNEKETGRAWKNYGTALAAVFGLEACAGAIYGLGMKAKEGVDDARRARRRREEKREYKAREYKKSEKKYSSKRNMKEFKAAKKEGDKIKMKALLEERINYTSNVYKLLGIAKDCIYDNMVYSDPLAFEAIRKAANKSVDDKEISDAVRLAFEGAGKLNYAKAYEMANDCIGKCMAKISNKEGLFNDRIVRENTFGLVENAKKEMNCGKFIEAGKKIYLAELFMDSLYSGGYPNTETLNMHNELHDLSKKVAERFGDKEYAKEALKTCLGQDTAELMKILQKKGTLPMYTNIEKLTIDKVKIEDKSFSLSLHSSKVADKIYAHEWNNVDKRKIIRGQNITIEDSVVVDKL